MKNFYRIFRKGIALVVLGYSTSFSTPDPRDSVIIESRSVKPGIGNPAVVVRVYITNKDSLTGVVVALVEKTLTGNAYMTLGYPRKDTVGGAVRRLTSTLQGMSIFATNKYNSVSPDSFTIAAFFETDNPASLEPPNLTRKAFFEFEFDTVNTDSGRIVLDTGKIALGKTGFVNNNDRDVPVNFVKGVITVDPISPLVTVTDPNGGESVPRPCPYTITWDASDNVGITTVEVWLDRTNGGVSYELQLANLTGNPGSYDWTPGGSANSSNAKIKVIVSDAAGNVSSDASDASFSIVTNCFVRPTAGFDINKDGIYSLVDIILYMNIVYTDTDESTINMSKEYIKTMLVAIFSSSP
ncbi:MAG TPA: Ig-like domain-containing protein [Verrucomicrobiae bacterium]|nr:Ig-like domain-containing protein [Verrucomicrobiae bacterium]